MATNRVSIKSSCLRLKNVRSQGIKAIALKEGDYLVGAAQTGGADDIMLFSNLGKAIRFNEFWEKSGNDEVEDADIETENEDSDGLDDENAENALPSGKHGVRPSGSRQRRFARYAPAGRWQRLSA